MRLSVAGTRIAPVHYASQRWAAAHCWAAHILRAVILLLGCGQQQRNVLGLRAILQGGQCTKIVVRAVRDRRGRWPGARWTGMVRMRAADSVSALRRRRSTWLSGERECAAAAYAEKVRPGRR
jgi:hypothetical protein